MLYHDLKLPHAWMSGGAASIPVFILTTSANTGEVGFGSKYAVRFFIGTMFFNHERFLWRTVLAYDNYIHINSLTFILYVKQQNIVLVSLSSEKQTRKNKW